jgi:membrane protease YdiL (CAAX protease family)
MTSIFSIHKEKYTFGEIIFQIGGLLLCFFFGYFIFGVGGLYLSAAIYGITINDLMSIYGDKPIDVAIQAGRLAQVFYSIGIFLVPAIIFPRLFMKATTGSFLANPKETNLKYYLFAILLYISFIPLLGLLIELNKNVHFPSFMSETESWMRGLEDKGEILTKNFLFMNDYNILVFNLIVMALIPAVTEEFFFRGLIQRLMYLWTGKIHLSIIITGCIFSFIHFQFFGFVPRAVLGILLGYILYYSGDIKVSILVHFINNGSAVIASYILQRTEGVILPPDEILPMGYIIGSIVIFAFIMFNYIKISDKIIKKSTEIIHNTVSNFKKVFETKYPPAAEIIKGSLEAEGIMAVILNKQDSSYTAFGWVEVYTPADDEDLSKEIIKRVTQTNE